MPAGVSLTLARSGRKVPAAGGFSFLTRRILTPWAELVSAF